MIKDVVYTTILFNVFLYVESSSVVNQYTLYLPSLATPGLCLLGHYKRRPALELSIGLTVPKSRLLPLPLCESIRLNSMSSFGCGCTDMIVAQPCLLNHAELYLVDTLSDEVSRWELTGTKVRPKPLDWRALMS